MHTAVDSWPTAKDMAVSIHTLTGQMGVLTQTLAGGRCLPAPLPTSQPPANVITTDFATELMKRVQETSIQESKERHRHLEAMNSSRINNAREEPSQSLPAPVAPQFPQPLPAPVVPAAESLENRVNRLSRETAIAAMEWKYEQEKRESMERHEQEKRELLERLKQ